VYGVAGVTGSELRSVAFSAGPVSDLFA
jgi:hypothetical protein